MNVVFSSYDIAAPTGATIVPIELYWPQQALFGTASLIPALAGLYKQATTVSYCYFPELISSHAFARQIQSNLLGPISNETIHVRVGSRRRARIIKGCRNVLMTSDDPTMDDCGTDSYLAQTLTSRINVLFESCIALNDPSGTLLDDLAQASANALRHEQGSDRLDDTRDSLEIASFQEFATTTDGSYLSTPALWQSSHLHHRALRRARAGGAINLLIALNLDHDQSVIPALLMLLSRALHQAAQPINIAVFPFNETQTSRRRLAHLAAECLRLGLAQQRQTSLYFALAPSRSSLVDVQSLFQCAVIDGADPDASWSWRHLAALGVPALTVGAPTAQNPQPDIRLGPGQERLLLDDELGARLVVRPMPTMAEVRSLPSLIRTRGLSEDTALNAPRSRAIVKGSSHG